MARLIPRKQIEEQQNITGSLDVGQDINVGNNAIISSSLYVSKSFFLGNDVNDYNDITGSVYLTGSLNIKGKLEFTGPEAILSATSSNALLSQDSVLYDGIRSKDFGANVPTLYVSATDGDDNNDGRSIQYPLRTIKRAAQLATPGYDGRYGLDPKSKYSGYVIRVQAGTYYEDNPVTLPKNSTIWGAGLRITKINAINKGEDLFYVNSGCYVAEVTMGGLRLYPDQINPQKGFAIAFQPGAFITTSPYIQNCSQISNQENSFTELYEEIPPGGGGLYVNGDAIHPDSPLCSMVLDAYTQISPNGVGCLVNGRGFIQLVSFFNNFSYYAIRVNNGGHATLNNSNISFGLYGMYASGSRFISSSKGGNTDARDKVRASWSVVVDVLNKGLEAGLPTITTLNTAEGIKVTSQLQQYLSGSESALTPTADTSAEVKADFNLVSAIVENGTSDFPTLLAKSSNKGYGFDSPYNILGATQITSSIDSASLSDLTHISQSFGTILSIFANGTGSYIFKSNTKDAIKVTDISIETSTIPATDIVTGSVSASFDNVINIVTNGLIVSPKIVTNNSASIKVTNTPQFTTGISSSLATTTAISASFSIVYNILTNGTGSGFDDIPTNHKRAYTITNINSSSYAFDGVSGNPTITLFRGEEYKFYVSASEASGPDNYPFFIRKSPISGITDSYDYDFGVVNNGDSVGNITFKVPYNAPNKLYYVAQNSEDMIGEFHIINSNDTPRELIASTITYPDTFYSSSNPSQNVDVINAYDQLVNNKAFIQDETIAFLSSSWSDFSYNETTCRRDIGYIVDGVAKDLLYGGNEESIRSGLYYYLYPSNAITTELTPTLTAVKYAAGMVDTIVKNVTFQYPSNENDSAWQCIIDNREFVQSETIAFISSSWSGGDGFYYDEVKCKRDVGYILDAVATDLKYGGNERSTIAGRFYYLYPSAAVVGGVPSSTNQLEQTLTGIRYAKGVVGKLITNTTFVTASSSIQASYDLLRANKQLIQNETIQFINVAYPELKYSTTKCRRDVGYIVDAIATDLLYGGNERSVTAGKNYYYYPSIATSTQKKETSGAIKYTKIISDYVVQNILLDTPRIIGNDEKNIRVTALTNATSSISGTATEIGLVSSSFNIVESIIKRGLSAIPSILAQNTGQNWGLGNPLKVSNTTQTTNGYVTPAEVIKIGAGFDIVNDIIGGGSEPSFVSSLDGLIKVTDGSQTTGSSATNAETSSISASFGYVVDIISNGTGSINPIVKNTLGNIKVTSTSLVSGTIATGTQSASISSSMAIIGDIITNGTSVLPTYVSNTDANIKVTNTQQYVSASYSGSAEDAVAVSSSISIVTKIIEGGENVAPAITPYITYSSASNVVAAYELLKNNITFIQNETIAYLSSSWSGFAYDQDKCKRDVGLIVSGAAEDLIWNSNSASVVNGLYYYEFPSQATGNQLIQTIDGINYASRLAQKLVENVVFVTPLTDDVNANNLLKNNINFIKDETIAYMSSSWGSFDYNEVTCRRDLGYIIDAVRTDLVYGGTERVRTAGEYYFLYPSAATGSQLTQTLDAINYASTIAQKIVVGETFVTSSSNNINASELIRLNKNLIANEVVQYVSSSWSGVFYNEDKCKRDVGYILDAVRTDLVYGGNERTSTAGLFYFLYPSSATIGGVPSSTAQLDPTVTGLEYGSRLAQNIVLNRVLSKVSQSILDARELVKTNTTFIQQNTIDFISKTYPKLNYNVDKCYRDVRFIVDGVLTDLVYGGNERSITSGRFYYKYPSQATSTQATETIGAINYAKELAKVIAIGDIAVERSFDAVSKIIESGSAGYPTLVSNTISGIKATNETQTTSSISVSINDKTLVSASFGNVINIISKGVGVIPTIVKNTNKGVNVLGGTQISSSITPQIAEINKVTTGFDIVTTIIANGTGSIPTISTNTSASIKVTNVTQFVSSTIISSSLITNGNSSFNTILNIVEFGTGSTPNLVKNASGLVKLTNTSQYSSSIAVSSSKANNTTGSFNTIINILKNGLGVIPTIVPNGIGNVKVTATTQYTGSTPGTQTESTAISASISIVADIVQNGIGNLPTLINYITPSSNANVLGAYQILKNNISFIQDETIAYLSSSWSTASYDEEKCRRDVGLIVSGAAEDLLWNANSASIVNGTYYYQYPSQAQGSQLNQTLDGIVYASRMAQKVVKNAIFALPSNQTILAYDLLVENKEFIQNETIAYISSSWSEKQYNETTCKRDVGYIVDAVATDLKWGGNERSVLAGKYYYLYPSAATGSQINETITGITYAKNIADKLIRGGQFQKVSQNKLDAKEIIDNNKTFIQEETIAFLSSSWNGFNYNQTTCKRDIGYILDSVSTDIVYGGNERSIEAGEFYYRYPSNAIGSELAPTLSGVRYAKGLTEQLLKNTTFVTASLSKKTAQQLILNNKSFIQNETIAYVSSSWSFFNYNEASCSRDTGYIVNAVATDILYGGNERVIEAGRYYYLYPSLATVDGDGDSAGQLGQTLDGINYAKGITEKIVRNTLLVTASQSETTAYNLLLDNKQLIQRETIAYISSSWTGGDGFYYNEASCSRDVAYIIDAVATDLLYGGNQRSSKAGEYYYLYPSRAIVSGSASPDAQLGQTIDGVRFAAGTAQSVIGSVLLTQPTTFVSSSVELLRKNRTFIQNETIEYIDSFFPSLVYNREKCRRDVGYIVDSVATDLFYGGNERGVVAGDYYYRYPSLATKSTQVRETVAGVDYAKEVAKRVVQNIVLDSPNYTTNTDSNIKVSNETQYKSLVSASASGVSLISASFGIVTDIIAGGLSVKPTIVSNNENAIKVTSTNQYSASISASGVEVDIVTSSFKLIRDIIYGGSESLPDALASNYDYGFQSSTPTLLHISSVSQTTGTGSYSAGNLTDVSSSYETIVNIIANGTGSIPTLETNASASIKVTNATPFRALTSGSTYELGKISGNFNTILNIIENGTSVIPTLVPNTSASVKVTNTDQIISGSGAQRLQGKIVSASFAIVVDILTNGSGSVQFVSGSVTPNTNSKINSAYHLLVSNSQFIVDETIAFMSSSWSTFAYDQTKCERDLGFIIDGAAHDLIYGGNSGSYVNGKYYYDFPSQATGSQLDQTVTAIKYASGLAEKVVQNIVLTHISASASTSASFVSLRENKSFIQSESIAYISSSWSEFGYNQATCERDLGYIVDAIATDLLYGGNERSIVAGRYYYDYPSNATTSELEPTLTGVRFAKGTAMNVVVNKQYFTPSATTQYSYDLLLDNKRFIQSESIAFIDAKYPNLDYLSTTCARDLGYIVDAVATDLLYGGNEQASKAGEFYYLYPSLATNTQLVETIGGVRYAGRLSTSVIESTIIPTPQVIPNGTASIDSKVLATYDLLTNNKPFIQAETIAFLSSSWSDFEYNQTSCSRDLGFIIDAVATDLLYGGNESGANAGIVYFLTASAATGSQLEPTVTAIDYASGMAAKLVQSIQFVTASTIVSASVGLLRANKSFIQSETMEYLTASWSTFNYDKVKCRRDVGYIVDAVTTDLLYGGNERSVTAGDFYFRYPSKATLLGDGDGVGQLGQTIDGIEYASRVAQKVVQNTTFVTASSAVSSSFDLLRKNKSFIAAEVIAYVSSSWSTVYYNEASCSRDIGYIVDAAATDLLYGGQERALTAGTYYYLFPSKATKAGVPSEANQLDPTITGVKYGGKLASKVITNPTFVQPSGSALGGRELLTRNRLFIQKETIAFLSSSWSTLQYNEVSCSRDVGFILDSVKTDLVYGGNERSIEAGSYYYKIPSVAIKPSYTDNGTVGQKKQTVDGINYARGIAEKIVNETQLVFPGTKRKAAYNRLIAAKDELKQRAIGYTNGAFPYLVYNEASCSRDTGLIVDAVATDLLYGGNERGIAAASSYYTGQYGSAIAVTRDQLLETLETNRYLRTRAEFVAAGAPLEKFGSLIVATGIDYSYNGAGVTFKALPSNQGGSGQANPAYEITELGGGRIYFTSGNETGDFRIGTGLSINQATGTLVGRTFSKSLFSLVTPFSLALQI